MKQRVLDTHFGHLINLKLKRFFYWAKLTATRGKLLFTDKFTFVKTQSLKDLYLVIFLSEIDFGHPFFIGLLYKIMNMKLN